MSTASPDDTSEALDELPFERLASLQSITGEDELLAIVDSESEDPGVRAAALQQLTLTDVAIGQLVRIALGLLAQRSAATELRLAALPVVKQAAFDPDLMAEVRTEYLDALHAAANAADATLRARALGVLAREQDPTAVELLEVGLREPRHARVPPVKAIQLLGYNVKVGGVPVAQANREAADRSASETPSPAGPRRRSQLQRTFRGHREE